MHVVLRPAGDQMFDTRAWRGPAVVGGDGIEPPTFTGLAEHDPTFDDFWFWHIADIDRVLCDVRYSG
jgi:hypothetical protein